MSSENTVTNLTSTSCLKKRSKYKNFLTTLLSPSVPKKPVRRKKSFLHDSRAVKTENNDIFEEGQISVQPEYSTIPDLNLENVSLQEQSSSLSPTKSIEPLYATVQKKAKEDLENEKIIPVQVNILPGHSANSAEIIYDLSDSSELSNDSGLIKNQKETSKQMMIMKTQSHNTLNPTDDLQKKITETLDENRILRKQLQSLTKEAKWKEETVLAKLRCKITQLETETRTEVSLLCEQIKTLDEERKLLSNQVHVLHEERQSLQNKYIEVCKEKEKMLSPEFLAKVTEEQQALLLEAKTEHLKEISRMKLLHKTSVDEKNSLLVQVEILQDELNLLKAQNESLEKQQQELQQKNTSLLKQLEEFKDHQHEAQHLLSSLLRVAENIEMERNVLLSKTVFQDHQYREIQTSVVDYGLNIGRLQEHVSSIKKRSFEETEKAKSVYQQDDESLKHSYEKQIAILRGKILNQSNVINELQSEKSQLESHLDSVWKTACGNTKPIHHVQNKLSFINV